MIAFRHVFTACRPLSRTMSEGDEQNFSEEHVKKMLDRSPSNAVFNRWLSKGSGMVSAHKLDEINTMLKTDSVLCTHLGCCGSFELGHQHLRHCLHLGLGHGLHCWKRRGSSRSRNILL